MWRFLMIAGFAWALPVRAHPAIAPALLDCAGTALTRLIEGARQQAIADGVRPIPPGVYRALLGYFPAAVLQRVRFAVGGRASCRCRCWRSPMAMPRRSR